MAKVPLGSELQPKLTGSNMLTANGNDLFLTGYSYRYEGRARIRAVGAGITFFAPLAARLLKLGLELLRNLAVRFDPDHCPRSCV